VFAYTAEDVYETKFKLYELEEILSSKTFFRANKAVIVNLNKIKSLSPAFGGRFEAVLKNDYKVIISRSYVPKLKELLGL
ncbi:MAG: LytTR family transcriptional regulator DNA-binding domain-containing protein, partial [Treponema sp.]|nr:LytTR family transcriptional regulator DNA-binding domain-containing protein [Treponema sp.]